MVEQLQTQIQKGCNRSVIKLAQLYEEKEQIRDVLKVLKIGGDRGDGECCYLLGENYHTLHKSGISNVRTYYDDEEDKKIMVEQSSPSDAGQKLPERLDSRGVIKKMVKQIKSKARENQQTSIKSLFTILRKTDSLGFYFN